MQLRCFIIRREAVFPVHVYYPIPLLRFLLTEFLLINAEAKGSLSSGSYSSSSLSLSPPAQICDNHWIFVAASLSTSRSAVPRNRPLYSCGYPFLPSVNSSLMTRWSASVSCWCIVLPSLCTQEFRCIHMWSVVSPTASWWTYWPMHFLTISWRFPDQWV